MKQRIVIELEVVIDAIGTKQTFYVATSGFSTLPTDTPANTYIAPRLKSAGSFKRELFSGTRVTGAVRPSFGELVLYNGDGGLDDWMGYGVSGGKVTVRLGSEDAAYPAGYTTVYVAYAQHIVADFAEIRVRLRDRLLLLERPMVTDSFAGSGGFEGTSEMAGKLKQWVSGEPGYFPPILVSSALQLYFVQSSGVGGLQSMVKVFEGALEITKGSDYATTTEVLSTSPSIGQARFYFGAGGDGPVYFRLGSSPKFDLRVFSEGLKTGGVAFTHADVCLMAGISGASGFGIVGSQLIDDNQTMLEVLENGCQHYFGYFWFNRLDAFISGTFNTPGVTPTYIFTQHNASNWSRSPVQDMDAPVYSLNVNAGKTWKSNLVEGADENYKDYMSRDPWWCAFSRKDDAVLTANPGAIAATSEISGRDIPNLYTQTTYLDGYFARFGVRRDFYTCTVPMTDETIAIELHDTVQIKLPRFGLSAGKNMRVITQQIDCDKRLITYGMWG